MKQLFFCLSILSLLAIVSCGSDENENTTPQLGLDGTVNFDGTSYAILNGLLSQSNQDGNTEVSFFLADGEITPSTGGGVSSANSTIVISMVAFAGGSESLVNGDYATSTNTTNLNVSVSVTIINGAQTTRRDAFTEGTVTISGSGNTYTMTFNAIPFGQGTTLSGSVSGTYGSLD